jgi:hypothetical protein
MTTGTRILDTGHAEPQVVRSDDGRPPTPVRRGPRLVGVATLSAILTVALIVLVFAAIFDLNTAGEQAVLGAIVATGAVASILVHRRSTPTHALAHSDKVRREQRHVAMLSGALVGVLGMMSYAIAFDLNSWAEWIVFGAIVALAVGLIIAIDTP